MSVSLMPATQITFNREGQGARLTGEVLSVKNPGNEPVIFKVKTTAPQYYCVKPNTGRVEPNSEAQIEVYLQPTKRDILDDRLQSKDKFLIQTAYLKPEYQNMSYIDMWRRIEQEDKESIHRHKIKCALLPIANETKEQQQQQQEVQETKPVLETPPDSPSATSTSSLSTADEEQETLAEQCQRLEKELQEAQQKIVELTRELAKKQEEVLAATAAVATAPAVAPAPMHTTLQENHPVSVAWTAAAFTFWLAYLYFF